MSATYRSRRREAIRKIEGGVAENVDKATQHYLRSLRKMLFRGPPRTGERYRVPGGVRRTYVASAPGEPPAIRTGQLANSYTSAPVSRYRVLVGSPLIYAPYVENGTSRMAPRPHFRKTFTEERANLERILGEPVL